MLLQKADCLNIIARVGVVSLAPHDSTEESSLPYFSKRRWQPLLPSEEIDPS